MASEYLKTGELTVFRQDADELLDIKRGKWDLARVKSHADELFAEMRSSRDSSKLPDEADRTGAEKLLAKILREHFASHARTDLPLALTALEEARRRVGELEREAMRSWLKITSVRYILRSKTWAVWEGFTGVAGWADQ